MICQSDQSGRSNRFYLIVKIGFVAVRYSNAALHISIRIGLCGINIGLHT